MKRLILPLLLLSVVLAGCTSNTTSSTTMTADQLFQKKQECARYSDQVLNDIKINRGTKREFSIDEIFYSPTRNSCIGVVSLYEKITNSNLLVTESWIYDILSKKRETTKTFCVGGSECNQIDTESTMKYREIFDRQLAQLKGE